MSSRYHYLLYYSWNLLQNQDLAGGCFWHFDPKSEKFQNLAEWTPSDLLSVGFQRRTSQGAEMVQFSGILLQVWITRSN